MSIRIYRFLVLASIIIGVGGGLIDLLAPSTLPLILFNAIEEYSGTLPESYFLVIGLASMALLLLGIISTVGLYFFRPWAPLLAVLLTILAYPIAVLLGPTLASGWAMALRDLSSMLWGGVLALTYFSNIKNHFARASH